MRIRSMHQSVVVVVEDVPHLVELAPVEGGFYEGEVEDSVGAVLLSISRTPGEYQRIGGGTFMAADDDTKDMDAVDYEPIEPESEPIDLDAEPKPKGRRRR